MKENNLRSYTFYQKNVRIPGEKWGEHNKDENTYPGTKKKEPRASGN